MLLTITTTHRPATDLGYLPHKHPARTHSVDLAFGRAHVFYPEAAEERCTAALLLDVDPVGLVRGRRGPAGEGRALEQYVNDRPYTASSFLSVAIAQTFSTALAGRSKERQALAEQAIPFAARVAVAPCRRGGEAFLRRLFEPLGYAVRARRHALDEAFPEWGESPYFTVDLEGAIRLQDLLSHLYVLLPVLDDDKHYWVGDDEVEKLLRRGGDWLAAHPEREQIAHRYLRRQARLARQALAALCAEDGEDPDGLDEARDREEAAVEEKLRLHDVRLAAVAQVLKESGARRVLDLGCGEGKLLRLLLKDKQFEEIVGLDVSHRALEIAAERLNLEKLPETQRRRITLLHGSLMYCDRRLGGYDAAAVVEVIEHLDPPRLEAFERAVIGEARPGTVVITTPNAEYNAKFETLPAGKFRHQDHRFEWTRAEFGAWSARVAETFGYAVRLLSVGPEDAALGAPTQMGVFTR